MPRVKSFVANLTPIKMLKEEKSDLGLMRVTSEKKKSSQVTVLVKPYFLLRDSLLFKRDKIVTSL